MALRSKSLILYGFEVTANNSSIDFKAAALGPTLQGTLRLGYYSLTALMTEIVRAMSEVDPSNTYSATADRTIAGGTQNRVTIETDGAYLDLLFASGPRAASSVRTLIGFLFQDYSGATDYTGATTAGTALIPTFVGYNYLGPEFNHKVFGAVNVSAVGEKEAIVFNIQKFIEVEFKYEPYAYFISDWRPFLDWAIQQKLFEFTPEISSPTVFYEVTFEATGADGKGLGYTFKEMLPQYPDLYQSGLIRMRQRAL